LNKEDDEMLEDVDSLMKMIGDKKKDPKPAPEKKPAPSSSPPSSDAGDFSALMKKLGMSNKPEEEPAPRVVLRPAVLSPLRPLIQPAEEQASPPIKPLDSDDSFLFESDAQPVPTPAEPPRGFPDSSDGDIRETLGRMLSRGAAAMEAEAPPSSAPAPEKPAPAPARVARKTSPPAPAPGEEEIIEIIDEDPKAALRKGKKIRNVVREPAEKTSRETEAEERIVSVDQISDISGLILPKGATFKIDEINLHGRINAFEGTGTSALPPEFAEIWKKEFSDAGFKDLDIDEEVPTGKAGLKAEAKKTWFSSLFKAIRAEQEEYDPKVHGPLVDLSFDPKPGIEEMEMYPVNEPYAFIRITYDHSTHEYMYQVLEPVLSDPEKDLVKELKERLFETLDINTKDISKEEARQKLRTASNDIMQDFGIKLSPLGREKIHYNMFKDFLGDGLIDPIMHDKYIEDISCDGIRVPLFAFHASYESMKTSIVYPTAEELDSFVTKLAQRAGKYISIAEPILDATMQDGSRIQMTLGQEVTAHGSTFTIRKFKDEPITPTDLIEWHTFSPLAIAYIWLCVEAGKSAIFAGGTASGKTTALNAISLFIPPMAKIVSLEDTREVKLPHPNWIPSVTRDSFDTAGRGEINMYELLRAAMRQRPEYIIVGEVRGKECQTLFQAMSTGHVTYSTTHADSVASVVHRIENPPMDVPRNMLSALDFILVQVQARVGGKRIRRNKQIVEILDIDPRTNELITNEVFKWRSATDEHSYSGKSYLLEEIMEAKGWSDDRMREELKRRQEVLEWMRIKKIRHYKDVAKILISYHRDPEVVIEKVRKDLYE
jgi:flagellar protein FlaI